MQDLNDMLYFAEVVKRGGFAAAGRALGLPRSRLSRRIAELEERLGVRLLQRTTRKLSLTKVGEDYYRHCAMICEVADAALETVEQVKIEPRGILKIACPVTLAQFVLGPLVPVFLHRYPDVKLDLRVSNRVVDLIEEGVDIALRIRRTLDDSGSLVVKNFGISRIVLLGSPGLLARQGTPNSLGDLKAMDTVSMSAVNGKTTWHFTGPNNEPLDFEHQPRYLADDLLTLKCALLQGVGITALPEYLCREELDKGSLVHLLPHLSPQPGIFHAVFPSRRGMVPLVRCFLDFLDEHIQSEGKINWPYLAYQHLA